MNISLLREFCATENQMRPNLENPVHDENWAYATNGRVAIRVNRMPEVDFPVSKSLSTLPKLFVQYPVPEGGGWPLPFRCVDCKGTGEILCPNCLVISRCTKCVGVGFTKPDEKDIFRPEDDQLWIPVGIQWFDAFYLRKLAKLTGLMVFPCDDKQKEHEPLCFRFDDGIGLLMPRRSFSDAKTDEIRGDLAGKRD